MRKGKINESEYRKIVDLYKNGKTQREIALNYNVSQATIANILKKFNIGWSCRKGVEIPISEYSNIINMYKKGVTQSEIAVIYNCSTSTISTILRKMNVDTRIGGSKITCSDVEKWKAMYENGVLLQDIAEQHNTTRNTVSRKLKSIGVNIDRYTYHFNEHYFDNIDSQDKAYILGMLWADGHNCVDRNSIILELQEKDVLLLNQINILTDNERPLQKQELSIKNSNWQNQYRLVWQSKHLSKLLESYGMIQRKSLVLTFPEWLDKNLYPHFIRGYFDGDGCISLDKTKRYASINMVGTKMFLQEIQNILKNNIGVETFIIRDNRARDPICMLRCGKCKDVEKILNWIYNDAKLKIERKYDKYQQFLQNISDSYCA